MFGLFISLVTLVFVVNGAPFTPAPIFTDRIDRYRIQLVAAKSMQVRSIDAPNKVDIANAGKEIVAMVMRLPNVPMALAKTGVLTFIQTGAVMVPLGMLLKMNTLFKSGLRVWVSSGSKMGAEWAVFSGVFAGGVSLFATLRDKDDRWNTYLGSGLASSITRIKDGPIGIFQGFVQGFAFLYAIDKFLPPEGIPTAVPMPSQALSKNAKLGQSIGSRSAAAAVKRYGGKRF